MLKSPVLVDVDDVVCALRPYLCDALYKATGKDIHYSKWSHPRLHETYGMSEEEFVQAMKKYRILERSYPELDAQKALLALRNSGHPVVLVTKRGWHPDAATITANWFERFHLPYTSLLVVPDGKSKLDVYGDFDMEFAAMIDDQTSNLDEAKCSGMVRATHLVDRPWNKTDSKHERSNSLYAAAVKIISEAP